MYLNNFDELNGYEFENFTIKVSKKWIRVYKETKSKINCLYKIEKTFDGVRVLNEILGLDVRILGMSIYANDFVGGVVGRLTSVIDDATISQAVGFVYDYPEYHIEITI